MIEGVVPCFCVNEALRSESTGNALEAAMLCIRPSVCPISWVRMYSSVSWKTSSESSLPRTRSSTCEVCTKRHVLASRTTSLYISTEALMISPERGSTHEGPMALATAAGT